MAGMFIQVENDDRSAPGGRCQGSALVEVETLCLTI
jgi:hypothetical protein